MAHYPDLSPYGSLGNGDSGLIAVGWLESGHEYSRGVVDRNFFAHLCALLQDPWQHAISPGVHYCNLCRFTGNGGGMFGNYRVSAVGCGLLYVPAGKTLYVSPSSVAHYVDAHEYCPPAVFQEAVLNCPEMRSQAYRRALLATPAREWMRRKDS